MVANMGDKYSSFLNPEEYRLAIYRPVPSELKYLVYQYTGIGIEVGYHVLLFLIFTAHYC